MGFSFRSMFQPATDPLGQDVRGGVAMGFIAGEMNGGQPVQSFQSPPINGGASPFAAAGPLFRTVQGESMQAAPIQQVASPFAAQGAPSTNSPLTVGDVLPQLPPELARLNGLSPDQPVAISPQVLDAALRSGQAALPIFEVYRVCPALFQTPVSPQDPRMVPLPASKLPRLIASAQQANQNVPAEMAASPFAAAAPMASPFASVGPGAPAPGSMGTALPPRRNGPPPPLADVPREPAPSLSLPGNGNAPVFPVASPFSAVAASAASSNGFGEPPPSQPTPPVSLFAPAGGGATPASPFAAFTPAAAPPPAPVAAPPAVSESPFTSLFGQKAVPTGQPAPDAPTRLTTMPGSLPGLAAQPSMMVGGGGGSGPNVRVSLATLLRGYSVAELGFDPIMVPSWIMTSLPASVIREWSQTSAPLVELGLLIDGVTDVGFRNVLNHAKRDFQLRVPAEEVQIALSGGGAPTLPNLASLGTGTPSSPPTLRVEPPAQTSGTSLFTSAGSPAPGSSSPGAGSLFLGTSPGMLDSTPSGAPLFSSPTPSTQNSQAAPSGLFTSSAQPPASFAGGGSPFQMPSAPPVTNPFAMPARPSGQLHPMEDMVPAPIPEPAPLAETLVFQAPPSSQPSFSPPTAQEGFYSNPTAPFSTSNGLSSAQLLGVSPAPFEPVPAAPTGPLTNPFTGKAPTTIVDVPEETAPIFAPAPERPVAKFTPPSVSKPEPEPVRSRPAAPAPGPASRGAASASALGIQSHNVNPDQILLRALLGTDEDLTPQGVVERVCELPGIAACVCLQGDHALSHVGARKPQAREFQRQATDLAHHLRTLAPLIGIENAETFTLTSGDRLMTFCFPEKAIMGVLHDAEPSLGLRDKITLIARELSRMLD